MQTKRGTITALVIAGVFAMGAVTLAGAQSDAVRPIYARATVSTNIAGVSTYPAPPTGFNPLTATDEELAIDGFPARPNKEIDANHYEMWVRVMTAARHRWTGNLKPVASAGRERMEGQATPRPQSAEAALGPNRYVDRQFSGVISTNKLKTWSTKTSFYDVWGEFTLPRIQSPFGTGFNCIQNIDEYNTYYWIGIDRGASVFGLGGGYTDDSCLGGSFEVGWGNNVFQPFGANHGDLLYVEASNSLGGYSDGYVFVEDLSTLTYGSWNIAPLSGTPPLVGNSVEWLVGDIFGAPFLGNTIGIAFEGADALNLSGKEFFPGSTTPATQIYTMVDGNGQNVEIVSSGNTGRQGRYSLFFETTGCAYAGGCPGR